MLNTILLYFLLFPSSDLQSGIACYNARAVNAKGMQADATNIDKAITIFESGLNAGQVSANTAYYYLASLNFKGQFVCRNDQERKKIYGKAVEEGNKFIATFPENAAIRFELITSIGLLAEISGVFKSAEDGVLNQMLYHSKALIKTDSAFRCCAGWKVLAILNYKTPYIPVLLSWPSKDEAKRLLQKALKYYPADISNNFYYAEALLESGDKMNAKIYFLLVTKLPARKDFLLEDENQKEKAKKYLAEWK
jgi:hypothetical protein